MDQSGEPGLLGDRDVDQPSTYRIYDYLLGGSFNFAVDRAFARQLLCTVPWAREVARANRAFLTRAVRFGARRGVRQFLDLGSGILAGGRVDEIAQAVDPRCRVAYVDSDPIAIAYAEVLTNGDGRSTALRADLRDASAVLAEQRIAGLLDLCQPVGLLMSKVLHFLSDTDDPAGVVAGYRDRLAAGSMVVITHATMDGVPDEVTKAAPMYRASKESMHDRSRAEITGLFTGWNLVEPGVVFTPQWRPDYPADTEADAGRAVFLAGVGIKP
ncbi:MAG TPA: SAM-dependent methyltransferase [Pseudonocardiaceae bacterium]|nr:SAM-dependent methyltransferase [Pseudonocardiaceae bacterium]